MSEDGAVHPIGVVAERTGLTPDVIRVWERRYGAVEPQRGRRGRRLYTDADIERLRLLRKASGGGRSIGEVAALPAATLAALVREDEAERRLPRPATGVERVEEASLLERSFAAVLELAPGPLESTLRRAIATLGLARAAEGLVAPLLRRIGEAWHAGRVTPAQEHMATAVTRRVLQRAVDELPAAPEASLLLLATPAGDRHELGLLLAAVSAGLEGWRTVSLGPDLPATEIAAAARRLGPRAVGLSAVDTADPERVAREIEALRRLLPGGVILLAGGAGAAHVSARLTRADVRVIENLGELRAHLAALDTA